MFDRRLIGVWRSDSSRTKKEIEARRDISAKARRVLLRLIGRLTLRYTRTRCHATLDGHTEILPYRVLAKGRKEVVLEAPCSLTGEPDIQVIRFQGDYYWVWVPLGGFREFFRKLPAPRKAASQPRRDPGRPNSRLSASARSTSISRGMRTRGRPERRFRG